jgi:hypothetical protein
MEIFRVPTNHEDSAGYNSAKKFKSCVKQEIIKSGKKKESN